MRAKLPRYPDYRPTESEWLGELPEGWQAIQLARINTKLTNGFVGPTRDILRDEGVRYLQSLHIKGGQIIFDTPYFVTPEWSAAHKKSILKTGDVLIVQTGDIGQVAAVTDEFAECNCHALIIVRAKWQMIDGFYLSAVLRSNYGFHSLKSVQTGALHPHLNCTNIRDIFLPIPPLPDQRAILAFLDRETTKIDLLIAVRQKQVECLQEQRTAVIHHAVTKGLDSQAKMTPSGVEWLGDVPEKWEVRRLKFWVKHISAQVSTMPEGHTYLALEHIEGKTGRIFLDEAAEFDSSVKLFKANDVLFGRLRPYLAKVALPDFDGVCVGELMVLRAEHRELSPRYLQLRLLTPDFIDLVDGSTQGAKMPRANWAFVGDVKVAVPQRLVQDAIVAHIERETAKIDTLIAKYQCELELLAEYRASLISHAVTGKIDVRCLVEPQSLEVA